MTPQSFLTPQAPWWYYLILKYFFTSLSSLLFRELTRCAIVKMCVLQNYVWVWNSQNYVSFLTTARRVPGRYSWWCWNLDVCLGVRF
jgi:hypothetical protein